MALGFAGGFVLGWGISSSFLANELMPVGLASGITLILIALPFDISHEKGLLRATMVYNDCIRKKYSTPTY